MFGEVRSAAQRAPGGEAWEAICAAVEGVEPARLREEIVPYLQVHLRRWPDAVRRVPARWLDALWRGAPAPIEALAITRRLALRSGIWRAAELEALADLPQLGHLTLLDLRSCGLRVEDLEGLEGAAFWPSLTALDLSHNALGAEAMPLLARWLAHSPLRTLTLAWNFLEDAGADALLSGAPLDALTTLDLSNNHLGAHPHTMSQWIGDALALPRLHTLRLGWNGLGDAGVHALLHHPWDAPLHTLDLSEDHITDAGAEALLHDPRVEQLRALDLFGNELTLATARTIAASDRLSNLRELDLSANPIGYMGRSLICRAAHLPLILRRQAEAWDRLEFEDDDEPPDV